MKFILRDYQFECVEKVVDKFKEITSQLIQLPTGSGKTVILWHVIKAMGVRTLIIAPTRELTEQIEETGMDIVEWSDVYRKKKSYWPKGIKHLILTGQGATFALRGGSLDDFEYDLLVVDEAHRSRSKSIEELIEYTKEKKRKVLGLTATPERLDGKSLLSVYDELTYTRTLVDLILNNYLVDLECYRIRTRHKIHDIKFQSGDLAASVLRELDISARNEIILNVYKDKCPGKKTLLFCLSVDHAKKMAELFLQNNIRAVAIYGALSTTMRKAILKLFKDGHIDVLCNCQLLTEGFDEPSIEALILARPTKSKALYCQMVGRGVRPFEGKETCLVYDLTDEIHNICNFNVLGGFGNEGEFEWGEGERLTKAVARKKLFIDEIDYEVEQFKLYDAVEIENQPAKEGQKSILWMLNAPYLEGITFKQAAYLIFKSKLLEENGYNPRAYWEKWREGIPMQGEVKRDEMRLRLIQRSRDSLHLGEVSGDDSR